MPRSETKGASALDARLILFSAASTMISAVWVSGTIIRRSINTRWPGIERRSRSGLSRAAMPQAMAARQGGRERCIHCAATLAQWMAETVSPMGTVNNACVILVMTNGGP